jgi:hypothetical protein
MKQIIVDIMPDGEIKIETRGFVGKACLEETAFLKKLLGYEKAKQLTAAFYTKNKVFIKKHLPLCG